MSNEINANGIEIETLQETLEAIIEGTADVPGLKDIYGADINTDSDTPDGQMINIYALAKQDILNLIVQNYNAKDPDQAIGVALDYLLALCGITRREGTYTQVYVNITVDRSVTLNGLDTDSPYTVADSSGTQFQLVSTANLSAGTTNLLFQASDIGAVQVLANSITVPVSIILGVTAINNPAVASTQGIDEETDADLRIRRQQSVSLPARGYRGSLLAGLLNIDGVTSAQVIENDTATGETARHTVTANGTAQLDTAQKVFGVSSLLLDGNSDYLSVPDSDDWYFADDDFTVDGRFRWADLTGAQVICGQYVDATHYWFIQKDASNKLEIEFSDGTVKGSYITTSAISGIAIDTWYQMEFIRYGASALIFVDGQLQTLTETTAFSTNDVGNLAASLIIGQQNSGSYFNGWIDEFRISKGIARHTAEFTPASLPYTGSGKTKLLLHFDGTDTSTTILDESDGQPAHSIWVIVEGGTDADIADIIYLYRNAGCAMKGDEAEVDVVQLKGKRHAHPIDAGGGLHHLAGFWNP